MPILNLLAGYVSDIDDDILEKGFLQHKVTTYFIPNHKTLH